MSPWKITKINSSSPNIMLRVASYVHPGIIEENIKQNIFFFTGRGEWIEKYNSMPIDLKISKSQRLVIWDHRGQGGSDGERSFVNSYDDFVEDAKLVIDKYSNKKPYYTVSHSMGGLIALLGYTSNKWKPEAIIMSSPLLLLPNRPLNRRIVRPVVALANILGKGKEQVKPAHSSIDMFANNDLTHDIHSFRRNSEQPFTYTPPTLAWVNATFKAISRINKKATLKKITCPVFIIGGSKEKVVDPKGWARWAQKAQRYSNSKIDFHLIHGARHELFSEIQKYKSQALKLYEIFVKKIGLNTY